MAWAIVLSVSLVQGEGPESESHERRLQYSTISTFGGMAATECDPTTWVELCWPYGICKWDPPSDSCADGMCSCAFDFGTAAGATCTQTISNDAIIWDEVNL